MQKLETIKSNITNYIKKFESNSKNETFNIQGEGTIGISPFDNYYLFNIAKEDNGENIYQDLTTYGDIYLDLTNGEVVFKISKENARRILSFSDNSFYISNKMTFGENESDESIIYTGKFYKFGETLEIESKKKLDDLKNESQSLTEDLSGEIEARDLKISNLESLVNNLEARNKELEKTNNSLSDQLNSLKDRLSDEELNKLKAIENSQQLEKQKAKSSETIQSLKDKIKSLEQNNNRKAVTENSLKKLLKAKNKSIFKFSTKNNINNQITDDNTIQK
jgi:hypothetical protein